MPETHIFVLVRINEEGYFTFQVGPYRSQRLPELTRFLEGELTAQEMLNTLYFHLGCSSKDVEQIAKSDTPTAFHHLVPSAEHHLYFFGIGIAQDELTLMLNGLTFNPTDLERIKGGRWFQKPPKLIVLDFDVEVKNWQDTQPDLAEVKVSRFLELEVTEYDKNQLTVCVQYGSDNDRRNSQRVISATLFWRRPFPPAHVKKALESKLYPEIRKIVESDSAVMKQVAALTRRFYLRHKHGLDTWRIADWWIS